jgi:hypothetical protein
MRVMMIRKADPNTEHGVMPSTELLGAMGKYAGEMHPAGIMLAGEGLKPSSGGKKVKFEKGKPIIIDGPFTETKELIAGFFMLRVKSMDEAIAWARKWPAQDGDSNVELELREIYEEDDFGEEFTPAQREHERKMRAEQERR